MIIWVAFWAVVVFASIAWYGFLLFYVGAKGGREILAMMVRLRARPELKDDDASPDARSRKQP
jgi:hypothetical protein